MHFYPGGYGDSTEQTLAHPLGLPELEGLKYKAHVSDERPRWRRPNTCRILGQVIAAVDAVSTRLRHGRNSSLTRLISAMSEQRQYNLRF